MNQILFFSASWCLSHHETDVYFTSRFYILNLVLSNCWRNLEKLNRRPLGLHSTLQYLKLEHLGKTWKDRKHNALSVELWTSQWATCNLQLARDLHKSSAQLTQMPKLGFISAKFSSTLHSHKCILFHKDGRHVPLQAEWYAGMTLSKHHCPAINYAPKTRSQLAEIIVMMGRTVMQKKKRENYASLYENVCL